MRETQAIIERAIHISADLFRLEIAVDFAPGSIQPGHYFLARVQPVWEPYLRERWEPVHIDGGRLLIDRHPDDFLAPGTVVDLLGPCGRPMPLRKNAERLLFIVQGVVPSPIIALVENAVGEGRAVTMVLDGPAQSYPLAELPPQVEVLRAPEGWAWADQVEALRWADQVIALAAPHETDKHYGQLWEIINQLRAPVPKGFALGLFTGPVPCGTGACGACLVRGRREDIYACIEGPALDLSQLAF